MHVGLDYDFLVDLPCYALCALLCAIVVDFCASVSELLFMGNYEYKCLYND